MEDKIVSFETAKLAKEKGFGLGENDYIMLPTAYELDGNLYNNGKLTGSVSRKYNDNPNHLGADTINDFEASVFIIDNSLDEFILAPTQSLLQKWLREVHKIDIYITGYGFGYYPSLNNVPPANQDDVEYVDRRWNLSNKDESFSGFKTYEEALEIGLQEALKLIK